jgi:hypothetical protein
MKGSRDGRTRLLSPYTHYHRVCNCSLNSDGEMMNPLLAMKAIEIIVKDWKAGKSSARASIGAIAAITIELQRQEWKETHE